MIIHLFPEQLQKKLKEGFDYDYYIFFGNDIFLLEDTKNFVLEHIKSLNSYEYYHFQLNNKFLLKNITVPYHTRSLFEHKKKIFLFSLFKEQFNYYILKKLLTLPIPSNANLLFIFHLNKLTKTLEECFVKSIFNKRILFVDCNTPKYTQLISWVIQRTKKMKLTLNDASCNLICSYYENDLNGLNQILYQLSIIYTNNNPNYTNVKNLIIDTSSHFNLEHLLNSILQGNIKRSNYILEQLKRENIIKPLTILRSIQHIIFTLIIFKRKLLLKSNNESQISLYYKHKIKKDHYSLFTQALDRLNLQRLYQVITLLLQTEIIVHQEHLNIVWRNFKLLIWLICYKKKDIILPDQQIT